MNAYERRDTKNDQQKGKLSNALDFPCIVIWGALTGLLAGHFENSGIKVDGLDDRLNNLIAPVAAFLILYPLYRWLSLYPWFAAAKQNLKLKRGLEGSFAVIVFAFILLSGVIGTVAGIYNIILALYSWWQSGDPLAPFS